METTELILSEDDKNELKLMQDQLILISRQHRKLKLKIDNYLKSKTVNILKPDSKNRVLINNDIELVYNYLDELKGKGVNTRQICDYLNERYKNKHKRWNPKK